MFLKLWKAFSIAYMDVYEEIYSRNICMYSFVKESPIAMIYLTNKCIAAIILTIYPV